MISCRILLTIIVICLILMPKSVLSQQKMPVAVVHDGTDSVGSRLVYQVKEALRRSGGFRLIHIDEPGFRMRLVTVDIDKIASTGRPGTATIYSVTITMKTPTEPEWFLCSDLGNCATSRINEVAEILVSQLDRVVETVRKPSK